VPGSIYAPAGRQTLVIKVHGVKIATGYRDSPHGRILAREYHEALYARFIAQCPAVRSRSQFFRSWYEAQGVTDQSAQDLDSLHDEFCRQSSAHKADRTVVAYRTSYQALLAPARYMAGDVVQVGAQTVYRIEQDLERSLLERRRTPATLAIYLRSLGPFCTWLYDQGHIASPIRMRRLKRLIATVQEKPIMTYTAAEISATLDMLRKTRPDVADIMTVIISTGMRIHEPLEMMWEDIDWDRSIIMVGRKDGRTTQYVTMTPVCRAMLERRRTQSATGKVFPWAKSSTKAVRNIIHAAMEAAGVYRGRRSVHELRKTFISAMVARIGRDTDILTVSRVARCTVAVLTRHYLAIPPETLRTAVSGMDKWLLNGASKNT